MFRKYTYLLLLSFVLGMLACQSKTESQDVPYAKPPEDKLDSLTTWFSDEGNFNNTTYLPQFYKHFNQKIEAQQWEDAAMLLFYTGQVVFINNKSDSMMISTHKGFIEKHQNVISDRYKSGLYLNLGVLYYYNSNFELAIVALKKATQIPYKDYHTLVNVSTAYTELGYTYTETGKLDKGLEAAFKALDGSVMLNDTLGVGAAYDAIGGVYQMMQDYKNAEVYMNKAIFSLNSTKHYMGVFAVYLNKLALYEEIDSPKLSSFIDSVYLFHQKHNFNNDSYKIYANSWKADQFLKQKKIVEAQKLLQEIRPLFDKSEETFLYSKYIEAASLHDKITGEKTISSTIFKQVITEYKTKKNLESLLICYDALKQDAVEKKNFKTALFYSDAYDEAYDSLTNRTLLMKTKELDKKYQTEKKDQQIDLQETEISKKNNFIALLFVSIIGLLSAVCIYYLWQKQKSLKQEKTNNMNFTKQLLESTEEERKRIASDLHDSISHELLNLKSIFKQDLTSVNAKIDTIINDIRGISRNLHPVMFDKIGLVPNIEQLVERMQNQNDFLVSTEIDYKGTRTSADELQIYRIIQEALTNIIKYAKAHAAKISILEENDQIFIEIKDNGIGFNVKETLNSGKAFGLHNIIERSRVIGGEAQILSSEVGTVIKINIPKK